MKFGIIEVLMIVGIVFCLITFVYVLMIFGSKEREKKTIHGSMLVLSVLFLLVFSGIFVFRVENQIHPNGMNKGVVESVDGNHMNSYTPKVTIKDKGTFEYYNLTDDELEKGDHILYDFYMNGTDEIYITEISKEEL